VVLEENCSSWRIVTSVNGLIFRSEVFDRQNNHLQDAVETDCGYLRGQPGSDEAFRICYSKSQASIKKRFCTNTNDDGERVQNKNTDHEEKVYVPSTQSAPHPDESTEIGFPGKGHTKRYALLGWLVGIVVLIAGGKHALCEKEVVQFFLGQNPVAFYETTEPLCHRLEQRCVHLSQMDSDQMPPFPPEMCRGWCASGIIAPDRCRQFLPFLPKITPKIIPEKAEENFPSLVPKSSSPKRLFATWKPDGPLILTLHRMVKLSVNNPNNYALNIMLTNLVLEGSSYEEIVQLRNGQTEVHLTPHQKHFFEIFIEPTYYHQFEKGSYHGHMTFTVVAEKGQKQTKEFPFSFEVK